METRAAASSALAAPGRPRPGSRTGWAGTCCCRRSRHLPERNAVSTHLIFPNTLARLQQLGVLDTLLAAHAVPMLGYRIIGFGHRDTQARSHRSRASTGPWGRGALRSTRRSSTPRSRPEQTSASGSVSSSLIGSGTAEDPVAGVVLEGGERISAKWVFGADGRGSTVAALLGIEKTRPVSGEVAFLLAYWRGIPDDGSRDTGHHARRNPEQLGCRGWCAPACCGQER